MRLKLFWWIHHMQIIEPTHSAANRRRYISDNKPCEEVENRLRALKPVKRLDLLPLPIRRELKKLRAGQLNNLTNVCCACSNPASKYYPQLVRRNRKEYPRVPLCECRYGPRSKRKWYKVEGT